jgi:hypothetical protein
LEQRAAVGRRDVREASPEAPAAAGLGVGEGADLLGHRQPYQWLGGQGLRADGSLGNNRVTACRSLDRRGGCF